MSRFDTLVEEDTSEDEEDSSSICVSSVAGRVAPICKKQRYFGQTRFWVKFISSTACGKCSYPGHGKYSCPLFVHPKIRTKRHVFAQSLISLKINDAQNRRTGGVCMKQDQKKEAYTKKVEVCKHMRKRQRQRKRKRKRKRKNR